jgi:hypothetical protein
MPREKIFYLYPLHMIAPTAIAAVTHENRIRPNGRAREGRR